MKKKIWITFFIVSTILVLLFCADLPAFFSCEFLNKFVTNVIFIFEFLKKYPFAVVLIYLIIIIIYWFYKYSLDATSVTLFGFTFVLRNFSKKAKANVRNHLAGKRAIFKVIKEYDNYYDVINSYYKTLVYLRNQIEMFEKINNIDAECYEKIEKITTILNIFLTKYQSNYRRYYEAKMKDCFKKFQEVQAEYPEYDSITKSLLELNISMKEVAKYFKVDTNKWDDFNFS